MFDPVILPAFFALFGQVGGSILKKAAEKHVDTFLGKALDKLGSVGQKSAFEEAMERAYGGWIEAVLKNLEGLGYDSEDLADYKEFFLRVLNDEEVGQELARPLLDGGDWRGPEVALFQDAWARLGCKPLPKRFQWPVALEAFERQVQKQRVFTPELREQLNTTNLMGIREELRRLRGARPEANERRYASRMRQRYRVLDLAALAPPAEERLLDIQLRDVFLPQDVRENPPSVELPWDLKRKLAGSGKSFDPEVETEPFPEELAQQRRAWISSTYTEQPRRPVLEILREPASRRIVLLGDPGSGKSTLAKYLLLSVLEPPREPGSGKVQGWVQEFAGHLPLLVEIREFIAERSCGKCETFLAFLDYLGKTQGYALEEAWLAKRLSAGPSLVIFDGLDEIFDAGDRERVMKEIAGFCSDYPKAWVVVTSRPVGYTDAILRAAGFRHFALQDLDDAQIEHFIRSWFDLTFPGRPEEAAPRIDRVLRACQQSRSVRLLAGNPMLLTIMAMIARQQELPRERARFYEYSAEVLCHHWDVNRRLRDEGLEFEYIGLDDKKELLRRIAFRMQSAREGLAGNFIHGDELQEEMEAYLTERYRVGPADAKRVTVALIEQLRSRNYILCLYGPGLYGFVHRTLLEYFCAAELRRRVHEDPDYPIEKLIEDVVAKHWQEAAWQEVLRLVCGMVGEAYAGKIIEYLYGQANLGWEADPRSHPPRHLVLATQCLGEVRNRYLIEPTCLTLLQEIVRTLEFQEKGIESFFLLLTLVQLPQALEEVGTSWPGIEWFRGRFLAGNVGINSRLQSVYMRMAVSLLGSSGNLRQQLEEYSASRDEAARAAALQALVQGWPQDPAVRDLLQTRALQDEDSTVRSTALSALARTWPQDPAVRDLLQTRALQDEDWTVRSTALSILAQTWPQDPAIRDLLQTCALQDDHASVRLTALSTLAQTWPQDPAVRDLLQTRALQDEDSTVRSTTLSTLAQTWPQDPAVRDLLQTRALQDEDSTVRSTALSTLARTWPQDPAVRDLFQTRALQDEDSTVRSRALSALARTWPQDPAVRDLLQTRALQDEDSTVRSTASSALART